jgi:hypothetical protein
VAIWYILWSFAIFYPFFGMLYEEKSGNPANALGQVIEKQFAAYYNASAVVLNTVALGN